MKNLTIKMCVRRGLVESRQKVVRLQFHRAISSHTKLSVPERVIHWVEFPMTLFCSFKLNGRQLAAIRSNIMRREEKNKTFFKNRNIYDVAPAIAKNEHSEFAKNALTKIGKLYY